MADRIAAHVTLVYPEEAPNLDLLLERLRSRPAARAAGWALGRLACFERPSAASISTWRTSSGVTSDCAPTCCGRRSGSSRSRLM